MESLYSPAYYLLIYHWATKCHPKLSFKPQFLDIWTLLKESMISQLWNTNMCAFNSFQQERGKWSPFSKLAFLNFFTSLVTTITPSYFLSDEAFRNSPTIHLDIDCSSHNTRPRNTKKKGNLAFLNNLKLNSFRDQHIIIKIASSNHHIHKASW